MNYPNLKRLKVGRVHPDKTSVLSVPALFWATGALGMLTGLWRLWAARHDLFAVATGKGALLAAVHCFTLAGLTMVMMGALYQLVPVLLNCSATPTWRAVGQWALYTVGIIVFVCGFNGGNPVALSLGGSGVVLGIGLFLGNMASLLHHRTTFNITGWFIMAALCYLAVTMVLGSLLGLYYLGVLSLGPSLLGAHMAVALGGWFGFLMTGVSLRLWAMFGRSHREPSHWMVTWTCINLAVVGLIAGTLTDLSWIRILAWVVQLVGFGAYMRDVMRGGLIDRRTMRDPALRTVAAGLFFLAVFEILGTLAVLGRHTLWVPAIWAYGLGWIGLSFIGFSQKLLAFMIWIHRYAHVHGRGKVPRLEDIWRPSWAYAPLLATGIGLAMQGGAWWVKSSYWFAWGTSLEGFAWLWMFIFGIRAVLGPHRKPD